MLKQAFYWWQKAAEHGNAKASYNLGCLYENGEGVAENLNQAIYWYQKASEQGLLKFGMSYINGDGVAKNFNKGISLLRIAARYGIVSAQNVLKSIGHSW